jgi:hypothetical protein
MLAQSGDAMLEYYRYLNSGYRLPLVGGTDKMSSAVPVGLYRTYARLDEEFSYEAWCRAVRSGRILHEQGIGTGVRHRWLSEEILSALDPNEARDSPPTERGGSAGAHNADA